jgi:hypothetical protein
VYNLSRLKLAARTAKKLAELLAGFVLRLALPQPTLSAALATCGLVRQETLSKRA